MRLRPTFVALAVSLGCSGCSEPKTVDDCDSPGDAGPECAPLTPGEANVAGCEAYVAVFDCGDDAYASVTGSIDCSVYAETTCDISAYFTCLADGYTCDEASGTLTPDADKLATCPDYAICR